MKKTFYAVTSVSLLIISLSVSYYYVIVLPNLQAEKMQTEQEVAAQQESQKEDSLNACLDIAQAEYDKEFKNTFDVAEQSCPGIKTSTNESDCYAETIWLTENIDEAKEKHETDKDKCYERNN